MLSSSGRYIVTYNGEIYNYRGLRKELERAGSTFRGDSDTEVLVNGFQQWGIETTLKKSSGMFALALWDQEARILTLARDRVGEKPLYYGWVGSNFAFASELKALRKVKGFDNAVSRASVASFMRFSYVPAPFSIYEHIYKLMPGTYLSVSLDNLHGHNPCPPTDSASAIRNVPYWSAREIRNGSGEAPRLEEDEAVEHLDELVRDSVERQMVSDVPLGAMLSGGIDSSTVVSVMQSLSREPIKTFTIGFSEKEYNEAVQAKRIAEYLKTDHTELYLSASETLDVVPRLPEIYDEPFGDASQIPTHLVSRLAREKVTVALSGDGGDELFGGYTRYLWADSIWRNMKRCPLPARELLSRLINAIKRETWQRLYFSLEPAIPGRLRQRNAGEKLYTLARLLKENDREALYLHVISHWNEHDNLTPGVEEHSTPHVEQAMWTEVPEFVERMMYLDLVSYLPDDILVKLDRASMSVSLETRVPFLDHRIVAFSSTLPLRYKIRDGDGKWILRKVLERYLPKGYFERPKMGFGVPIGSWLKGPLRGWAEDLLEPSLLERQGYLNPKAVRAKWEEHLHDKGNWQYHLWDVLMFQSWIMKNG